MPSSKQPSFLSFEEYQEKVKSLKTAADATSFAKELIAPALQSMLEAEMSEHLGYEKHDPKGKRSGNNRNGHSMKTLRTSGPDPKIRTSPLSLTHVTYKAYEEATHCS